MTTQFNTLKLETIEQCAICLEDMLSDEAILAHRVGDLFHAFHEECVRPEIVKKNACPYCRVEVTHINGTSTTPPPFDIFDHFDLIDIETCIVTAIGFGVLYNGEQILRTMYRVFPYR